jgi:hypothetical protein
MKSHFLRNGSLFNVMIYRYPIFQDKVSFFLKKNNLACVLFGN